MYRLDYGDRFSMAAQMNDISYVEDWIGKKSSLAVLDGGETRVWDGTPVTLRVLQYGFVHPHVVRVISGIALCCGVAGF